MSRTKAFTGIPVTAPPKNVFDLSHDRKYSTRFGKLTPVFIMDVVPGDKVSIKSNLLLRFAPLVYPVMHEANAYIHFFYVPNRILWPNWENFITGGESGNDASVWPYLESTLHDKSYGTLFDYMGLPVADDVGSTNTYQ